MPEESIEQQSKSSQKPLNWKRILNRVFVAGILIGLGVLVFLILQPREEPTTSNTTKQSAPSTKVSTPSAKKDETADWKTITFEEQGFSFKYPSDKLFLEFPERCFRKSDIYIFWVRFHLTKNSPDWENSEYYKKCILTGEDGSQFEISVASKETNLAAVSPEKSKTITVAGQKATMIYDRGKVGGEGGHLITFNKNGKGYTIYIPAESSGPGPKIDPMFEQIISTFKFLD